MNKKADEKYYIVISFILVILIMGLGFYFLFKEYFTSEEMNWETCKQSITLRGNSLLEGRLGEDAIRSAFPFKCQTQVINVNNVSDAPKIISDAMASCWSLYGEGKLRLYGSNWLFTDNQCFICYRIHFSKEIVSNNQMIDVGTYFMNTRFGSGTYFDYVYGKMRDTDVYKGVLGRVKIYPKNGDVFITFEYVKNNAALWEIIFGPNSNGPPEQFAIPPYSASNMNNFLRGCNIETAPA